MTVSGIIYYSIVMRYDIRVVPNAKQKKVVKEPGRLKVYLTVSPVDGKANKALLELLAEYFSVRKKQVRIVKGQKNRNKVVEIV